MPQKVTPNYIDDDESEEISEIDLDEVNSRVHALSESNPNAGTVMRGKVEGSEQDVVAIEKEANIIERERMHELEQERRIQVLKDIILVREQKQLRKLEREFKRYNDVDGSEGECCCACLNADGARYIVYLDLLLFLNLPRFITAILALRSETRMGTYAKTRMITMFIECTLAFLSIIAYVIFQTYASGGWGKEQYVWSLVGLSLVIIISLVDFHFCKVVQYRWRVIERAIQKEAKAGLEEQEEAKRQADEELARQREQDMPQTP